MLDTLIEFPVKKHHIQLQQDVCEKFLQQALVQSVAMDDRNIARMLSILSKQAKQLKSIEDKRLNA
jgi:hypothetical protein